jgi:hypothetical protein
LTQSTAGNNVVTSQSFCYDALNRLTNYALSSTCTASGGKTVGYDALGDITSKSDVGTYTYPTAGNPLPHAVSSITGTVNGVTNPTYTGACPPARRARPEERHPPSPKASADKTAT